MRREVVASRGFGGTPGRRGSTSSLVQVPEKSGLPFDIRGVAAVMSTLPSAFRGAPAVGYLTHWAVKYDDDRETRKTIMAIAYPRESMCFTIAAPDAHLARRLRP